jgi:hypothetical protein
LTGFSTRFPGKWVDARKHPLKHRIGTNNSAVVEPPTTKKPPRSFSWMDRPKTAVANEFDFANRPFERVKSRGNTPESHLREFVGGFNEIRSTVQCKSLDSTDK